VIQLIRQIAVRIETAFQEDDTVISSDRRIPSSVIFRALRSIRPLLENHFGDPIKCRYPGYRDEDADFCSQPEEGFRVLEYLVDFSFSRFSIPQAIGDHRAEPIQDGRFKIVFSAESELGTPNEVCRDLLKLLDVRSSIRCLLFSRRVRQASVERLNNRILSVLNNHAFFDETRNGWLFISLYIQDTKVRCCFYTLGDDFNSFALIQPQA